MWSRLSIMTFNTISLILHYINKLMITHIKLLEYIGIASIARSDLSLEKAHFLLEIVPL